MKAQLRTALLLILGLSVVLMYGVRRSMCQNDNNDKNGSDAERNITLAASAVRPGAKGDAQIQFSSAGTAQDQGLEVHFQELAQTASYQIRIGGKVFATVKTDANGSGGVVFQNQDGDSNDGDNQDGGSNDGDNEGNDQGNSGEGDNNDVQLALPKELDPVTNIGLVEVLDSSGQVMLTGNFNGAPGQNMISTTHIMLSASGPPQASGRTLISFESRGKAQKQSVLLQASGLAAGRYNIVINGWTAGELQAGNSGSAEARFFRKKKKNTLPPEIDPVLSITSVQILDSNSRVVLSGRLGS